MEAVQICLQIDNLFHIIIRRIRELFVFRNHSCNLNAQTWRFIHGWIPPWFPESNEKWGKSSVNCELWMSQALRGNRCYLILVSNSAFNLFDPLVSVIPYEISWTRIGIGRPQYESPAMYTSFERNSGWSISHYTHFNINVTHYSTCMHVHFAKLEL